MTIEIRMHHRRQVCGGISRPAILEFRFLCVFLSRDGPATRSYQSRVLYLGICERALYFVSVISFVSRIGFSVCAGCAGTTKRLTIRPQPLLSTGGGPLSQLVTRCVRVLFGECCCHPAQAKCEKPVKQIDQCGNLVAIKPKIFSFFLLPEFRFCEGPANRSDQHLSERTLYFVSALASLFCL
jgi:hypothetical protein